MVIGVDEMTKTVTFVGDYFTTTTTVVLDEGLRHEGEDDEDFAARVAATFLSEQYGFDDLDDKATVSVDITEA